ncbi:phage integrase N-terminal SAM-like domain-containing protein [Shewanella waksmanii]|uniref:phage integrase N-terminal SAM-like domain-containing protein n=1 Tax=Shewanella waksmanii TaxID=213783 RepID=UPI0037370960
MGKSPFIESIRAELRTRRYSLQTEKSYLYWIKAFIYFNDKRHPQSMGNIEIERFLNHLAVNRQVSAATQNQALCAFIRVYRYVINQ